MSGREAGSIVSHYDAAVEPEPSEREGAVGTLRGVAAHDLPRLTHRSRRRSHRSLGQLAWHLAVSIPEMMARTGLRVPDFCGPTRDDWVERGMEPLA